MNTLIVSIETAEIAEKFRKRVAHEDQLLINRTTIVLELNGLAAVAVGLNLPSVAKVVATAAIVIIDIAWVICAVDALWYISKLQEVLNKSGLAPLDEVFRWEVQKDRFRISSTKFMSLFVPLLLLAGWLVGFTLTIWFRR